jgi:hypothetical protein
VWNVPWTACWREKELPVPKDTGPGYSLRRNGSSSMISRSAQDLPKLMMAFPTGWDRLLDNRDRKEQVWQSDIKLHISRAVVKPTNQLKLFLKGGRMQRNANPIPPLFPYLFFENSHILNLPSTSSSNPIPPIRSPKRVITLRFHPRAHVSRSSNSTTCLRVVSAEKT